MDTGASIEEWECWCSGRNALTDQWCGLCETPRPADAVIISTPLGGTVNTDPVTAESKAEMETPPNTDAGEVLRQLQRCFKFQRDGLPGCYEPKALVDACSVLKLEFACTSQNDASEFYDKVLDTLEGQLKGTPQQKALTEALQGVTVRQKHCHKCGTVTVNARDPFMKLTLECRENEIEKGSLTECLDSLTAPEEMTGDNKVNCDHCNEATDTSFNVYLASLPPLLVIHPKRFAFDMNTFQTVKLNHRITFPRVLDMSPYTEDGMQSRLADESETGAINESTVDPVLYDLIGVVVHRGRAGAGHYYSFIKRTDVEWIKFNDDKVTPFDPATLDQECFGGEQEVVIDPCFFFL